MTEEKKVRVIVSLTTIPSRVNKILPVLQSLLQQTYPFEALCLYVSEKCTRQNTHYEFPEEIAKLCVVDKRFQIKKIDTDWGPATKIIPAMMEYFSPSLSLSSSSPLLISVDDDVVLEQHSIQELVSAHEKNPEAVLGFMGYGKEQFVHAEHVAHDIEMVDSLGGYRSILYPPLASSRMPFLWKALHEHHIYKLQCSVMDDDHGLQECAKFLHMPRYVIKTNYPCIHDTPETRIVRYLNIRFLEYSATEGVSNEGSIFPSRDATTAFFSQLTKDKMQ